MAVTRTHLAGTPFFSGAKLPFFRSQRKRDETKPESLTANKIILLARKWRSKPAGVAELSLFLRVESRMREFKVETPLFDWTVEAARS